MAFNSLVFLVFLPLFLAIYWTLKGRARIAVTLAASYIFYGFWDYRFLSLIIVSTLVDFAVARMLAGTESSGLRRCLVTISVVVNLGILGFFKYCDFFADNLASLGQSLGITLDWATLNIILPVGISFYTFQTLSYTIDVFRKNTEAEKDLLHFATFVAFFPQLVAGPIVRTSELLPQFKQDQPFSSDDFFDGLGRVLQGFFKKLVIADTLAVVVDPMFAFPEGYGSLNALLVVCLFSIQVYADFSGYSDIAIGCARMMGMRLPENFRTPFFSTSFRELWRRWHITLSTWLRDYVYISLGGSRGGSFFTARNIFITMLLGGLWHGANWTFILWGALHGAVLGVEHFFMPAKDDRNADTPTLKRLLTHALGVAWVFGFFTFSVIIFRSDSLGDAWLICQRIASLEGWSPNALHNRIPLLKALALSSLFLSAEFVCQFEWPRLALQRSVAVRSFAYAGILWALALFGTYDGTAFVYFQF